MTQQLVDWSPTKHIEDMDRGGVAKAMTSVTLPAVWIGGRENSRQLSRICNDYAAKLERDYPGRFGMFAALPLPDLEGSLRELEYALDVLHADGVSLVTSYGDRWLGDPYFNPVFEELNRRKVVVYTHPRAADCCHNLVRGVSDTYIEYQTDTSRAIARYVFSGTAQRYPNVRMIFSHAGGAMPYLIGRFDRARPKPALPQSFREYARRFYYDTAQAANPAAMSALKAVVPTSQILFGSDFPYLTTGLNMDGLRDSKLFTPEELASISYGNAARLLGG